MKYFGTDGIRGITLKSLSNSTIKKFANGITNFLKSSKQKKIIIGNDSRKSGDYIISVLSSVLLRNGIEIHDIGVCSSPCLAYLTKKYNYPVGVMITASHNPANYNGLKLFSNKGEKFCDEQEIEFERLMEKRTRSKNLFGERKNLEKLKLEYVSFIKGMVKFDFPCIFDCANGGTSKLIRMLFPKQEKINHSPNGENINQNSGCTHIEMLKAVCQKKHVVGVSFDGDGDRVFFVSKKGQIIDGDKVLFILSKFFLNTGDTVVGTIYTNRALESFLQTRKINFLRADVGDKNISKLLNQQHANLGGEESGHIIFKPVTNTGDGILTAVLILNILQLSMSDFETLLSDYTPQFQARENVEFDREYLNEFLSEKIKQIEQLGAKVIIRKSGTEPVLRIFVEHKNQENAKNFAKMLKNLIKY